MRLRNIPGADAAITESVYCIKSPETHKGHWQEIFPSQQPLHIEIGMGKGRFMMDLAAAHPDINYLGIERYSSVLLRALQKMEENPLPNLFFICMDAADVAEVFDHGEVEPDLLKLFRSVAEGQTRQAPSHLPSVLRALR